MEVCAWAMLFFCHNIVTTVILANAKREYGVYSIKFESFFAAI